MKSAKYSSIACFQGCRNRRRPLCAPVIHPRKHGNARSALPDARRRTGKRQEGRWSVPRWRRFAEIPRRRTTVAVLDIGQHIGQMQDVFHGRGSESGWRLRRCGRPACPRFRYWRVSVDGGPPGRQRAAFGCAPARDWHAKQTCVRPGPIDLQLAVVVDAPSVSRSRGRKSSAPPC